MSLRPLPLLLVLTLPFLAGCLSTGPDGADAVAVPEERYSAYRLVELRFTASDGTLVSGTAYVPDGGSVPEDGFGTIVNLSPYYGNLYGIETDQRMDAVDAGAVPFNRTTTGMFLAHGFAFVAASTPGTGRSGSCFDLGGLHEQRVLAEFIDWVGGQEWSNGNVGTYGGSYDGTTQWMVAIQAPEHLKTIVPWVSITDWYDYEYQDGAPYAWWGPVFVPYYLLLVGWGLDPLDAYQNVYPEMVTEDLCPGAADHVTVTEKTYATGVYDDWWQERNYADHLEDIQASVFLVQGLQDWNVKPLNIAAWDRIHTEKRYWLEQMQHNQPWRNTHDETFGRDDYNATLLAWYDHYLDGADNGVPAAMPGAWVQDQTGLWREEPQWPPADVQDTVYRIGDGVLTRGDVPAGQTVFVTPPSWATLTETDPSVGLAGPDAPDEVVAKFATEPLSEPMRISGVPHLDLRLSTDKPGYPHLVAQLYLLHADGSWEWLDMGGRGLAQRVDRTRDDAVRPLQAMDVPVDLNPTESFLDAGDRLVLTLAGDDPAWFHPNGNLPTFLLEHGSTLTLPLLPADTPRGMTGEEAAAGNPFYQADPKQF